jgi:hypothetical protein
MSNSDEPRYVWVAEYDEYGDRWIHGVYDSEEKALSLASDYKITKCELQ